MSYTVFGEGRIILSKELLNILSDNLRKVKSSLFQSRMVQRKSQYLKMSALQ